MSKHPDNIIKIAEALLETNKKHCQEINELESQVEELKEANNRTNVVSHVRGKSLINERDRTAELEKVLKDIFNKISEVLK